MWSGLGFDWISAIAGLAAGLFLVGLWRFLRLMTDTRRLRRQGLELLANVPADARGALAREKIEACKNRLRWQRNLNPEWITPLVSEIPILVRDIAQIYHPKASDPIRAPGVSEFVRAVQLTAMDIADFLQRPLVGRLLDVGAGTAWKAWEVGRWLSTDSKVKVLNKWYKRLRPIWQGVRYSSPWMWASLLSSNVAVRVLQPAVVEIVAQRAIQLYGGSLATRGQDKATAAGEE